VTVEGIRLPGEWVSAVQKVLAANFPVPIDLSECEIYLANPVAGRTHRTLRHGKKSIKEGSAQGAGKEIYLTPSPSPLRRRGDDLIPSPSP